MNLLKRTLLQNNLPLSNREKNLYSIKYLILLLYLKMLFTSKRKTYLLEVTKNKIISKVSINHPKDLNFQLTKKEIYSALDLNNKKTYLGQVSHPRMIISNLEILIMGDLLQAFNHHSMIQELKN